jgi:predicted nucleotidyltransferase
MTTNAILDILKNNNDVLKKHHVSKIGLFGSYARGEEKSGSDIDLLVEFDESAFGSNYKGYFDTVTSLSAELCSLLNQNVDLVTIDMLSPHIAPDVMKEVKFIEKL